MATSRSEHARPSGEQGFADGPRAVPLAVLVVLCLDALATPVGAAFGISDIGPSGLVPTLQRVLLVAAAAATMWFRPRPAVVLTSVVVALLLTAGPTGEELWLQAITAVTAAIRASWRGLGLVVLAHIAYALGFGWLVGQRYPGEAPAAVLFALVVTAAALAVGLIARRLVGARDRRRRRVQQLAREQTEIRTTERQRLADELHAVVTQGLAMIESELEQAARHAKDAAGLHAALEQVDRHSRSLLAELRVLLDVLRRAAPAQPDPQPADGGPRSWIDLLTARHVRIAATTAFGLLAARAALGAFGSLSDAEVTVRVIGWAACAVAVWRPRVGAGCAVAAVLVSLGPGDTDYWDLLATALICLVAAACFAPRGFWLAMLAVIGYAAVRAVTEPDPVDHVLLVGLTAFFAVAIGLAARHFVAARVETLHQLDELDGERVRVESEERSAVARELHDLVAHSLSVITMLVMATSLSDDRDTLLATLDRVRQRTNAARSELDTLLHALRGPDSDEHPLAPLVTPTASASALGQRLGEHGHHPVLDIDAAADELDPTTQRTLSRIMQEAATNILRYAPAGSPCHYTLVIEATGVQLTVLSPMADRRSSDLSLGWGLRGIRERVELTRGTFRAGPEGRDWRLAVTLPHPEQPSPAAAGLPAGVGASPRPDIRTSSTL